MIQYQTENKLHSFSIDLLGCRITELVLNNTPILWSGIRPDGGQGSTHPCLPNFGQVTEGKLAKLPQHGPARKEKWQRTKSDEEKYRWEMQAVEGVYPEGLVAYRSFELDEKGVFTLTTSVHNHGRRALPINPGEHCYFHCPASQRDKVFITDKQVSLDAWKKIEYWPVNQGDNSLNIPSIGVLNLWIKSYQKVTLWSLPKADFVCIEPVWGEPNTISARNHLLKPDSKIRFVFSLSLKNYLN